MYNSLWETTTGREKAGKRRKNMEPNLEKRSRANTVVERTRKKKRDYGFFFFIPIRYDYFPYTGRNDATRPTSGGSCL